MMRSTILRLFGVIGIAAIVAFGCTDEDSSNPDSQTTTPSTPVNQPGESKCTTGTTYKCITYFGVLSSEETTCKDNKESTVVTGCVSGRCDEVTGKCDDVLCENSDVCKEGEGCAPRGLCMPFECEDDSQCDNKYCDNRFCVRCNAEHPCSDGLVCKKGRCTEAAE